MYFNSLHLFSVLLSIINLSLNKSTKLISRQTVVQPNATQISWASFVHSFAMISPEISPWISFIWKCFGLLWSPINFRSSSRRRFMFDLVYLLLLSSATFYVFITGALETYKYARSVKINIFSIVDLLAMNIYRLSMLTLILQAFAKRRMQNDFFTCLHQIDLLIKNELKLAKNAIKDRSEINVHVWPFLSSVLFFEGILYASTIIVEGAAGNYWLFFQYFTLPIIYSNIFFTQYVCLVQLMRIRFMRINMIVSNEQNRLSRRKPVNHCGAATILSLWKLYDLIWRNFQRLNALCDWPLSLNFTLSFAIIINTCYYALDFLMGKRGQQYSLYAFIEYSFLAIYSIFCVGKVVNLCHKTLHEVSVSWSLAIFNFCSNLLASFSD